MATRRIINSEKTILEKDDQTEESNISPAVPSSPFLPPLINRDVIVKLLGFTFAMIVAPIGSYFLTVHTIFKGQRLSRAATASGGLAALLANVVLITYIIVAMKEDDSARPKPETKKDQ
ncbi:Vacuolar ATPase assembly integral membrane protein VMA21-like domain protein [Metarhizium album ARSEF 1941]|uniref:Vacuolar ATPase assembly integral membrane protein VMA21-like domain protein n=1 Tax=Metarhizium album (strain ARSEF 1941) TaxID=1081103 RepID=A0A0B2WY19_METAS|nr:Vacuolar ATPase assembly integral membrane protein VMA21-like domain protein [Metarhizium album ARSEF 1941]KHN98494.1 Vacuolar ATPase assembly integral membrane protein VMA21-like domain protein [Metarhizium album ARSEF 1941]